MANKIKIKINPPLNTVEVYHGSASIYTTMVRRPNPNFSDIENALYAILFDLRSPATAKLQNQTYEVLVKESGAANYTPVKITDENLLQNFARYNITLE